MPHFLHFHDIGAGLLWHLSLDRGPANGGAKALTGARASAATPYAAWALLASPPVAAAVAAPGCGPQRLLIACRQAGSRQRRA